MSTIPILLGLVLAVPANSDESALGAARLPATDKAILNFFHKRSQPPPARAAIEQLARALGSENRDRGRRRPRRACQHRGPRCPRAPRGRQSGRCRPRLPTGKADLATDRGASSRPPARRCCPIAGRAEIAGRRGGPVGLPARSRTTTRVFEEFVSALSRLSFRDGKADPALLAALKSPKAFTPRGRGAGVVQSWRPFLLEDRSAPVDRRRPRRPAAGSAGARRRPR